MADYRIGDLRRISVELASRLRLRDVRVVNLGCSATNPLLAGPFEVESRVKVKSDVVGDRLGVEASYRFRAVSESDEERPKAWSVDLRVVADYEDHGDGDDRQLAEFSSEECRAFGLLIGLVTIHPYAREIVQNASGRMGYPPFTADILESVAVAPDDAILQLG